MELVQGAHRLALLLAVFIVVGLKPGNLSVEWAKDNTECL
jgi:hypothetical protein